jgi:hypothetical protein
VTPPDSMVRLVYRQARDVPERSFGIQVLWEGLSQSRGTLVGTSRVARDKIEPGNLGRTPKVLLTTVGMRSPKQGGNKVS